MSKELKIVVGQDYYSTRLHQRVTAMSREDGSGYVWIEKSSNHETVHVHVSTLQEWTDWTADEILKREG